MDDSRTQGVKESRIQKSQVTSRTPASAASSALLATPLQPRGYADTAVLFGLQLRLWLQMRNCD